ncbi:PREDICTED: BTB/POZ domain-containing protein 6-B-like isoform X2 [Nicrophorus vespilloides]|nr:PREDICTED: BTB/POZ domain-containing protein 6-B-like isoform X2 [Nicrophorus vespilloides]
MSSASTATCDWQTTKKVVTARAGYLLDRGLWSDCRFIVGIEPNQQIMEGHKLFLAMASPVFEAMFFGGIAEKDPIAILDVQPEAFKALLEYIYTDKINFTSFDQACELCYGAKKYMLPLLVEECTHYLWRDLHPKNACRAYEFAKLFEEPILMDKCCSIIRNQTLEVLTDPSFEEAELNTVLTIFDQEYLNINSELELFGALSRYAAKHNQASGAKVSRLDANVPNEPRTPDIRDALMKIRFLTLSPQQFAEGPATSDLLTQAEKFAILMKISSPTTDTQMPTGFTMMTTQRNNQICSQGSNSSNPLSLTNNQSMYESNKLYCTRQLIRVTECLNESVLDCVLTFTCDKNVCVLGIQVPSQIMLDMDDTPHINTYTELLYAHLLDADGSRLTYTHYTSRVLYRSLFDISFNRAVYIQKNKIYKVGVVLNKMGWYPIGVYQPCTNINGVSFMFGTGDCGESSRDGLIRSIIFSTPSAMQQAIKIPPAQ